MQVIVGVTVRRTPDAYSIKVVGDSPKVLVARDATTKLPARQVMMRASEDMSLTAALCMVSRLPREGVLALDPAQLVGLISLGEVQP